MQSIPVQSWNFEHESVVRIGRSTDNHVILYSAVVSRHHVEIRQVEAGWEIVNLGANGTYLDGKRITQVSVEDGVIIRLARSGPNVQIHLGDRSGQTSGSLVGEKTVGQSTAKPAAASAIALTDIHKTDIPEQNGSHPPPYAEPAPKAADNSRQTAVQFDDGLMDSALTPDPIQPLPCCHAHAESDLLFCPDCGKPLRTIGTAGDYHLVQVLDPDEVSLAYLAWKAGLTHILKTPLPVWLGQPEAVKVFEQESRLFLKLDHPGLPTFVNVFMDQGRPYVAMEPFYGRSLEKVISTDGAFSLATAIARLEAVCEVLIYLHTQTPPLLHQRIKPAHLIQPFDPTAPLLVAGLTPGRAIAPLRVTAEYAAPEQQQGHGTVQSDLYALGPTLAYLVTGQQPETFYAQREQGFRFYAEYVPGLTAAVVAILRKLTNPQPSERFATAEEVLEALHQLDSSLG